MSQDYTCPHCNGVLNPGRTVIFVVEAGEERELFLLSPELGDYTVIHRESFKPERGTHYTFRCPICHADIKSSADEDLVEIHSVDEVGRQARVNFSRVYGQRATFVHTADRVERYGEDAAAYEAVNFFGAGDAED